MNTHSHKLRAPKSLSIRLYSWLQRFFPVFPSRVRHQAVFVLAAILLLSASTAFAERWKVQYFFDESRDTMVIEDLAFPSAQRGIAVGAIIDELGQKKPRYVSLATSDGGAHWSTFPLTDTPRSIFFLDDSTGWMVTDNAFWLTEESGRSWKRIAPQIKPDKKISPVSGGLITRVWFVDAHRGFAVGLQKAVYQTKDGGVTWTPIIEAAQPAGNPAFTAYTSIAFPSPKLGMIFGSAIPPRRDDPRFPEWMEPERAVKRRQVPTLTLEVKTFDGGESWKSGTAPLIGSISTVRYGGVDGLYIYQYNESFEWPSEVYHAGEKPGSITSVYKSNLRVTDCAVFAGPRAFLAAVEPPGKLNSIPIPGKVRILSSTNWTDWTEMDVDYKANARSLIMAGPDAEHLWVATDTGMILHLIP
jgi:hypothetical protein